MSQNPRTERPLRSQAVLEDIGQIVEPVYDALERGIHEGKAFFLDKPVDPFLFPNLVRYYALEFLVGVPKEIDAFNVDRLSNNGICLSYRDYRIRIWKADEGELPAPGNSDSRLEFFEQPDLFPNMRLMKLAIIWDTTSKGTLKKLMLVCPKGDGNPCNQTGQVHWQIEIPHPATKVAVAAVFRPDDSDLELDVPPPQSKKEAKAND